MALGETLNQYFDNIYVINLDSRPDRWSLCVEELAKWGIEAQRISAVDGKALDIKHQVLPGNTGCILSHRKVIRDARYHEYSTILILEDDALFKDRADVLFLSYMSQVPDNWDMLYLGGNHNNLGPKDQDPPRVSKNVFRISNTYTTHAYALRSTVFDVIEERLSNLCPEVDVIMASVQKECNAYSFVPNLVYQRADMSDIMNVYADYSFLKER